MAADGARAENAYAHGFVVPMKRSNGWSASFHKLAPRRNHADCATSPAERDGSIPAASG
jgi:hypothetical protein